MKNVPDIHASVIEGAFWNVFYAVVNKGVTLLGQLALAWFLMPADMGLANMAQAMAAFAAILSTSGFWLESMTRDSVLPVVLITGEEELW